MLSSRSSSHFYRDISYLEAARRRLEGDIVARKSSDSTVRVSESAKSDDDGSETACESITLPPISEDEIDPDWESLSPSDAKAWQHLVGQID